ncbi:MAG: RNA polymerase sigma-70 factor [Balneolaceae bacterium]|nr:RNA polymerase sigma-70 factor [Balneolaceae bacterium]
MNNKTERYQQLVERIREGDREAFEQLFQAYYSRLCVFSNSYVKSLDLSRDVVQEVYIKIWDNREQFHIRQSLKAYLYQAVRNQSLNFLQQKKQMERLETRLKRQQEISESSRTEEFNAEELSEKVWRLVDKLPERRRAVFILYRKHGLSYAEIAEVLGIARKTVENQMGKSLQFLRENLDL